MKLHSFISPLSGSIVAKFDHGTKTLPLLVKNIRHYIDYIVLGLQTFQGLYQSQLVLRCTTAVVVKWLLPDLL